MHLWLGGIESTDAFILKHRSKIPYFNYSNPVKHFYDQSDSKCNYTLMLAEIK
jgi:hypothetical protein